MEGVFKMNSNGIYSINFTHPQDNLPTLKLSNPEKVLSDSFIRYYKEKYLTIHNRTSFRNTIFIREFPVQSLGIADLVVISTKLSQDSIDNVYTGKHVIRAFEFKIQNWKGGLKQAFRYKRYADASFLVLPTNKAKMAIENIELFKTLKVGLWVYDQDKSIINPIYTPRPTKGKASNTIHRNLVEKKLILSELSS